MALKGMDGTRTQTALGHRWHLRAWMGLGHRITRTQMAPKGMNVARTQTALGHI